MIAGTGPGLPAEMRKALGEFLGKSVTENTRRGYGRHWTQWCAFMLKIGDGDDPFMRKYTAEDKAPMVALFLKDQYGRGLRDKGATAASAGIRMEFTSALEATTFFDEPILTAARSACASTTAELREKRGKGAGGTVKLPLCLSLIADRRETNWASRSWGYPDIDRRALYLATMWAFDVGGRVSEYTAAGKGAEDHCVRAGDLTFDVETESSSFLARGGEGYFESLRRGDPAEGRVCGCWVRAVSHKTGKCNKTMLIGRRSDTECQLLDDLVEWITHAGIGPNDELFSRYATVRGKVSFKRFWPRGIREEVKAICAKADMDPNFFSAHSLRKGSQTHMSALGVSLDDRRDRGNYSATSLIPATTYDYSTAGHGALSSSSLGKGAEPGIRDIQRYLPIEAAHPGGLGGGGPH